MSDIIAVLDRLAAPLQEGETYESFRRRDQEFKARLILAWPKIRGLLREAEQYKADSADRLVQMVEERSRLERRLALAEKALEVKEQLNETIRRCCDEANAKLAEAGHG